MVQAGNTAVENFYYTKKHVSDYQHVCRPRPQPLVAMQNFSLACVGPYLLHLLCVFHKNTLFIGMEVNTFNFVKYVTHHRRVCYSIVLLLYALP